MEDEEDEVLPAKLDLGRQTEEETKLSRVQKLREDLEKILEDMNLGRVKQAQQAFFFLEQEMECQEEDPEVKALKAEMEENPRVLMMREDFEIVEVCERQFADTEGFKQVYEDKAKGMHMSARVEESGVASFIFGMDKLEVPLFNLCCLIYEVDLYKDWFPFCKNASKTGIITTTKNTSHIEVIFPYPFANREQNLNGFGVMNLLETDILLLCVRSADWDFQHKLFKPHFYGRENQKLRGSNTTMITYNYGFEIKPLSRDSFQVRACMHMNPQMGMIPQGLINYFSQQFIKFLFGKMLKICKNFEKTPWEARLKENFESDPFYKLAK